MEPKVSRHESNQSEETDDQLLDKVIAGQAESFNQLVKRYRSRIFSYGYYLLHSCDDAEDMTQETFVRAYLNLKKFRREASFYTWLFRIASNVGYQHIGKLSRQRKMKENYANNQPAGNQQECASPETMLLKTEVQQVVFEAMQQLRPKHREALILKEINGLEVQEVANICRVPEGTIKSRLNRARTELKKQINRMSRLGGELVQ